MQETEDVQLISRVSREKDREAFNLLYQRYSSLLLKISKIYLTDNSQAEDVVQRVFLHVWEHADKYNPERGDVKPWLNLLVKSRCIDQLRRLSYRRSKELPIAEGEEETIENAISEDHKALSYEEEERNFETRSEVRKALQSLPEEQRRVIEAAYFEGLSQSEISEKFKQPLGTVKTRMRLGMLKLAGILAVACVPLTFYFVWLGHRVIEDFPITKVVSLTGHLTVNGKPVETGSFIQPWSRILTDRGSKADLRIGRRAIMRISEESEARIFRRGRGIMVELTKGELLSMVRTGDNYRVKTPNTVVSVRGTTFFVKVLSSTDTYVCICDGGLSIQSSNVTETLNSPHHKAVEIKSDQAKSESVPATLLYHDDNIIRSLAEKFR